ncbi:MAG: Cache 3/Cache 2 fusion domain-containing protein [Bacteroidales bacterium]
MIFQIKRLIIKSKLYAPVGVAIIFSISIITVQAVYTLKKSINNSIEQDLYAQTGAIIKIIENERKTKLENVEIFLKIAHDYFYTSTLRIKKETFQVKAINQFTGFNHNLDIKIWEHNGKPLYKNNEFVDKIHNLTGATSTIFQRIDSGFIRISTNVPDNFNKRALFTYIPDSSVVIKSILKGETYIGRAFVVNDWYVAAYEPIIVKGSVEGILYVGIKEKNLLRVKEILNETKVGKNGSLYVFDENGKVIINKLHQGENWAGKDFIKKIQARKQGIIQTKDSATGKVQVVAFNYFSDFKFYIAAIVNKEDETKGLINSIIWQSVIYGSVIMVLLFLFVYFVTTEKLHTYLNQLEISNKKLRTAREALESSENKFRTLFNNSSDEVFVSDFQGKFIEVNQVACQTHGYQREELLQLRFFDIKTKKYRPFVTENIKKILEKGYHTYETEHVSKSGMVIPFEMKSKLVDYEGRQLILSIARNISERKAIEKKIVQTIIETEIKERKRFAADLHDGLGPVLSAIKLYSDLIKRGNFSKMSLEEAVLNIEELVSMAITNTKEISNNITPTVLEDFGLAVAIQEFCAFISRTKSIQIDFDSKNYSLKNPSIEATILYQTAKELINNTLKHANAKNIRIELKNQGQQVVLYYRDDGQGFDLEQKLEENSGLGLNNIINKIKTLKGSCDFNSNPGRGMFVIISLLVDDSN